MVQVQKTLAEPLYGQRGHGPSLVQESFKELAGKQGKRETESTKITPKTDFCYESYSVTIAFTFQFIIIFSHIIA
jgi:hypothetical protein